MAHVVALEHGEVLGGVEGEEVFPANHRSYFSLPRLGERDIVLIFHEVAHQEATFHPGGEVPANLQSPVQITGVDGVDEAVAQGGRGADGDDLGEVVHGLCLLGYAFATHRPPARPFTHS